MPPVKSRAVVLRTHMLGETSRIVVCYTEDYGKVRLVAKGVRKGGGPLGAALEPMLVSGVVFYLHRGRELSLVSQAEVERQWPELRRDVVRMAYAGAALELADALISELEPDGRVFELLETTLGLMAETPEAGLEGILWWYELSLAAALGYAPDLARCVECGAEVLDRAAMAPLRGGVLCESCASEHGAPAGTKRGAAGLLLRLVGDHERGHALPDRPSVEALEAAGRARAGVRDEINETLLAFLEEHAGRRLRLKSLSFLAQVRRVESGGGKAACANGSERKDTDRRTGEPE
jgi:DNA repair protein RecO (recombination protein O)